MYGSSAANQANVPGKESSTMATTENHLDRSGKERLMQIAAIASVAVAVLLIVIKAVAWLKTGSVAMLASLLDSVLDGAASTINLLFVRRAIQPANQRYRFGHGKAEPIGGMFQAIIIGASALFLIAEAGRRLLDPVLPTNTTLGIVIMLVSSVMIGGLVILQRSVVKKTGSFVISADALHGIGDVAINLGVIVALVASTRFNAPMVDPIVAILLAGVLIRGAWEIGGGAVRQLMDVELSEEERQKIREIALANPAVRDIHDLRTRRAGLSAFIQMHIELDGNMRLAEAHEIADAVELAVQNEFEDAEVLIHQDPQGMESVPEFLRE